ncbi:MAG: SgcJ/EcaC family oxidoreductase [Trebonia sp.]
MTAEHSPAGLSALATRDQEAITRTLTSLLAGFRERDADKLTDVYSDDADWGNAFGSVKQGRQEILTYLRGLFADANFNAGTLKAPPQSSIRVLTDEVVIVSTHLLIEGQKLLDGGVIDGRDNRSLHVLQRQGDGTWPVVSEIYMDANRGQSYAGHS